MPNSKRTIYKPKKGRNVSQKKLYRLPSKHHVQKGGDLFGSIASIFKGGEVPGAPAVDGDGNIVDVEDDKKEEPSATNDKEEKVEESAQTPDDSEEEQTETSSPSNSEETPATNDEEKKEGILKGIGDTMGKSLSDATSEVQGYITQPAAENESSAVADDSDDDSLMESSNVNIQVPCDELLAENKQLREKIDQLQEEIKELLKNQLNKLESNESDLSQDSTNEITPNMGENSDTYDMSPMAPEQVPGSEFDEASESMDQMASEQGPSDEFGEASESMNTLAPEKEEVSSDDFSETPENDESNNVEGNTGGTKKHRKKNRKTKRKRNKHVSFHK